MSDRIYNKCREKMQKGIEKYGEYIPETDTRDLLAETIEELLDAVNYITMHRVKMRENDLYLKDIEMGLINLIYSIESKMGE